MNSTIHTTELFEIQPNIIILDAKQLLLLLLLYNIILISIVLRLETSTENIAAVQDTRSSSDTLSSG